MRVLELWRLAVRLVFQPAEGWEAIARAPLGARDLILGIALPLSLLPAVGTLVGMTVMAPALGPAHGYLLGGDRAMPAVLTTLVASMATVFVLAGVFVALAPMYRSRRDYLAALNVAVLGAAPLWLAGILLVLPALALVSLVAFCHSAYLYYVGAGEVLRVEADSRADFVGISMVLIAVLSTFAGAAASSLGLM
jgi:hypothetical protein